MAINRKSGNAIVGLLLAHGEKLGIAVVAALCGWLIYSASQYEGVSQRPDDLATLASQARDHMQKFTVKEAIAHENGLKQADEFTARASFFVNVDRYVGAQQGWSPSVVPRIALRADPPLLPPVSLIASARTELMGFEGDEDYKRDSNLERIREERAKQRQREEQSEREAQDGRGDGGSLLEPESTNRRQLTSGRQGGVSLDEDDIRKVVSYVTVLAKVPVHEQTEAYWQAFENSMGFNKGNDQPVYLGYTVQRREIVGGRPVGEWGDVNLRNGYDEERLVGVDNRTILKSTADWLEKIQEVAARDFTHEVLTFPLPPVVGRSWGPDAVHPEVPLEADYNDSSSGGRGGSSFDFDGPRSARSGGRDLDLTQGGGIFGGDDALEVQEEETKDTFEESIYKAPFLMLRFFDMTVEAGRQYQYRVRLVVADPNEGIKRSFLDQQAIARIDADKKAKPNAVQRFRLTDWSEPTPAVSVPRPGGVLIVSTQPARNKAVNVEPSVTLRVDSFGRQEGDLVESSTEKVFQRGSVANFLDKDVWYIKGRELIRTDQFLFRTDLTVLDFAGGEKLGRDNTTPASMLMMDASGKLVVRRQLLDAADLRTTQQRYDGEDSGSGSRPTFDTGSDDFFGGGARGNF